MSLNPVHFPEIELDFHPLTKIDIKLSLKLRKYISILAETCKDQVFDGSINCTNKSEY